MKVNKRLQASTPCHITDICFGSCFLYRGRLCMRIEASEFDYINLETGETWTIDQGSIDLVRIPDEDVEVTYYGPSREMKP